LLLKIFIAKMLTFFKNQVSSSQHLCASEVLNYIDTETEKKSAQESNLALPFGFLDFWLSRPSQRIGLGNLRKRHIFACPLTHWFTPNRKVETS
jgi:hypothetical protein